MSQTLDPVAADQPFQKVTALLGGDRVLHHHLDSQLDVHEMLLEGLPGAALKHLVDHMRTLQTPASLEKAIGMSLRTFQRHKETPARKLSPEQSGRTWKFAEILAQTIAVFGTQEAAEEWMARPAMGLDRHRPIDLLATPAGIEMVETFLGRLRYGVYT